MKAIILGGAKCVYEDVLAAKAFFEPDLYIAINDIGAFYPQVDHWVSKHPMKFREWKKIREMNGHKPVASFWTARGRRTGDLTFIKIIDSVLGGGGLLAARVAVHALGCTKVILCGVPLQPNGDHFNMIGKQWKEASLYRKGWEKEPNLRPHLRSLCGWTREVFGAPTVEWANQE